jgi:hypothetical protein
MLNDHGYWILPTLEEAIRISNRSNYKTKMEGAKWESRYDLTPKGNKRQISLASFCSQRLDSKPLLCQNTILEMPSSYNNYYYYSS